MTTPGGGGGSGGDLGSARGKIIIDAREAQKGANEAGEAVEKFEKRAKTSGDRGLREAARFGETFGLVVAGGIALAVTAAANFEQALANVAAAGGKDAANQMEAVRAKALQLGADTKFSSIEAAQAMEVLIKAGLSVTDVLNGAADAAVDLAAAEGITIPEAAEIAAVAMTAFNLQASQMPAIANKISQAASSTKMDVNDFAQAMNQAGAVSKLVGLSFEDMTLAITAMGKAGIVGSDAGTSLKTMLLNLVPSTGPAREAMRELGLLTKDGANAFYDAHGRVKSMTEVSEILYQATRKLTPAQRQLALETIFGSDAIRAAAIIAEQGAAGMKKLTDEMNNQLSVADKAKIKQDTLQGSLEKMKGSVETAAIKFGEVFIPVLRDMAGWLEKLADWFSNLPEPVKKLLAWLTTGTAALVLLGLVIGTVGKAVKGLMAVFTLLRTALMAHPVFLIAAAIAGLVAVIIANWDKVTAALSAGWNFLKTTASDVWNAVSGFFVDRAKDIADRTVAIWDSMGLGLETAWNATTTSLKTSTEAIGTWFSERWQDAWDTTTSIWNTSTDWIVARWNGFTKWFSESMSSVGTWFKERWNDMVEGAQSSINWLGDRLSDIGTWIKIRMGNFGSTLWNHGRDLIVGLWDGIQSALKWLWENIKRIGSDILDWFGRRLGISSPSKFTFEFGEFLTLGLGKGVESRIEDLRMALNRAGQVIEPTLSPYLNPATNELRSGASGTTMGVLSGSLPGVQSGNSTTVIIERLEIPIKAWIDPTDPVQWREAMKTIRDGINDVQKGYGGT